MSELDVWLGQVTTTLDLAPEVVAEVTGPVLDMVRDIAHDVVRPGAPMTAFLIGLAAGAGDGDAAAVRERLAQVSALVDAWRAEHPAD
ncbi:MAG: molybdopterin-guanine dinucleotide biosynthesis protein MobA [Actinobacteria bacterium]|nr:molybdopterin-guanine dinucleotide biosynthesis protein MobA [Actinomycetota bacterium]